MLKVLGEDMLNADISVVSSWPSEDHYFEELVVHLKQRRVALRIEIDRTERIFAKAKSWLWTGKRWARVTYLAQCEMEGPKYSEDTGYDYSVDRNEILRRTLAIVATVE